MQAPQEAEATSTTPEWDSLGPILQNNLLRQHREGGIKARTNPVLTDKVEKALKTHTDEIADLNEQLAKVEEALNKATLAKDLRSCRDERISLLTQIADASKTKRAVRTANEDYVELTHMRKVVKASEWIRTRQVTGILGELKSEGRGPTDDAEIAEFENAQKLGKAQALVVGLSLDLSDFQ